MSTKSKTIWVSAVGVALVFALVTPADAATVSYSTLVSWVKTLRSQMASVISTNKTQATQIGSLASVNRTQATQLASLTSDLGAAKTSLASLDSTFTAHALAQAAAMGLLSTDVDLLKGEYADEAAAIADLTAKVDALQTGAASQASSTSALAARVTSMETTATQLKADLGGLGDRVTALEGASAGPVKQINIDLGTGELQAVNSMPPINVWLKKYTVQILTADGTALQGAYRSAMAVHLPSGTYWGTWNIGQFDRVGIPAEYWPAAGTPISYDVYVEYFGVIGRRHVETTAPALL